MFTITTKQMVVLFLALLGAVTLIMAILQWVSDRRKAARRAKKNNQDEKEAKKKVGFCSLEFSKRMLYIYVLISVILITISVVGCFIGKDVTPIAALAGTSLIVDGTWGGFYLWKSKNENRAKYAQQFVMKFADKYGIDAAIRLAEVVLKD